MVEFDNNVFDRIHVCTPLELQFGNIALEMGLPIQKLYHTFITAPTEGPVFRDVPQDHVSAVKQRLGD